MTLFSRKTIACISPLGERLRSARESMQLTLAEAGKRAGVQPRYLAAIEAGSYRELPGEVYTKNFLRVYAELLNISIDRVFTLYQQEREIVPAARVANLPQALEKPRVINTTKILKRVATSLVVAGLFVYLGLTVRSTLLPPDLTVTSPTGDMVLNETVVDVEGTTETESIVTINGKEITLNTSGTFQERVHLQYGLNVIKVVAKKKHSKEQIVYRRIIVSEQREGVTESARLLKNQ